jgi:hypothetical protein
MDDDLIRGVLRAPERPVDPDPGFRDALLELLLEETGRRSAPRVRPRRPNRGPRRTATIAAVLVGTFVVLAAVTWPLRELTSPPQPGTEITPTTPFRASFVGTFPDQPGEDTVAGDFEIVVSYRAPDAWRVDVTGGSAPWQPLINENVAGVGSYLVRSGEDLIAYDADSGRFVPQRAHPAWFSPLNLLSYVDERGGWHDACSAGSTIRDTTVAGRAVDVMRCPAPAQFSSAGANVELWVDRESKLILRLVSEIDPGQRFPFGPIAWYQGQELRATTIEYGGAFAPGAFAIPSGAPTASAEPSFSSVTSLSIGDPVASLRGTTLEGSKIDIATPRGLPTVVYLWADWCQPCTDFPLDVLDRAFAERGDELRVVTIGAGVEVKTLEAFVDDHRYRFPVVVVNEPGALEDWAGVETVPTLMLIDADGRLAGAYAGWSREFADAGDLEAVLDALVAGEPLPEIPGSTRKAAE